MAAATALITGASGLLGQHVMRAWNIPGLELLPVTRDAHDLLDPGVGRDLVRSVRPAVVIHLAWTASGTPGYRHAAQNKMWVAASLELVNASREIDTWFVGTGTSVDAEPAADPYSVAKAQLWQHLKRQVLDEQMTWLRPYYVIDPGCRRPALVEQVLAARDVEGTVALRTPASLHDFVHAEDVGRAVVLAIREGLLGTLPIGSGSLRRVSDVAEALHVPWRHEQAMLPPMTQAHAAADTRRLRNRGWSPTLTEEFFDRE